MGKKCANLLRYFDSKVLEKIYGLVLKNGCWRRSKNSEIYKFYDEYDVVQCIKLGRLTWDGHVLRMEESDPARQSFVLNQEEMEIGEANQSWGDAMIKRSMSRGLRAEIGELMLS
jgi:hypothetical protein